MSHRLHYRLNSLRALILALLLSAILAPGTLATAALATATLAPAEAMAGGGPPLLYVVSGVVDDGSVMGPAKVATSITCTNPSLQALNLVIVYYDYSSANAYSTGAVVLSAGYTLTYSTHPTAVFSTETTAYTSAISQGFARIYASSPALICTAVVLDSQNTPPVFMSKLLLHTPSGIPVNHLRHLFLPEIMR
jgi:hypothetical protein